LYRQRAAGSTLEVSMERFDWGLLIPLGGMVMTGWVFYAFVDAFRQW
jgi:hypothetical protein